MLIRWTVLIALMLAVIVHLPQAPGPVEATKHQQAEQALSAYLGPGQFTLTVDADLDRSSRCTTRNDVAGPESQVVTGSQCMSERYKDNKQQGYEQQKSALKVDYDRVTETIVEREPRLRSLHAVVVLQRPADRAEVADLVFTALGMDASRGDQVLVVESQHPRPRRTGLPLICLGLGVLLGLLAGRRLWHRPRRDWV